MAAPFDHIASAQNSLSSKSAIGQLQRKRVWRYIEKVIPQLNGFEMLELNFGTGEDAELFGEKGFNLVATDLSSEMLKVTHKRAEQVSMQHAISSHYLDLESFDETLFNKKFDLIFSNFGGLNCINPDSFQKLLNNLPSILKPGGRFIGVVMPKFCAWEIVFFLLRLQFKRAFRRFTSRETVTDLHGSSHKTWFYGPAQIKRWSKVHFKLINIRPVGLALPSAYLDTFINFKRNWLLYLNKVESRLSNSSLFSGMADNYLIDLQLM